MTNDESTQIEDLLAAWYDWQRGYFPSLGAGRIDPSCRGFAENERHLDVGDLADAAERRRLKKQSEQIDLCVDALTWQQRASIQTHFKNRTCDASVWSNPRITLEEMHALYQEAKAQLLPAFSKRGLIRMLIAN